MKKNPANPEFSQKDQSQATRPDQNDFWENCRGQCGFTPWCRQCTLEKEKMIEEKLNREGRPDDKKQ